MYQLDDEDFEDQDFEWRPLPGKPKKKLTFIQVLMLLILGPIAFVALVWLILFLVALIWLALSWVDHAVVH
jgi:hypothetical protein